MSSHVGRPTAGPCARTVRHRPEAVPSDRSASTLGVAAENTALYSSSTAFSPYPSRMHTSTGRPRGKDACGCSVQSVGRVAISRSTRSSYNDGDAAEA